MDELSDIIDSLHDFEKKVLVNLNQPASVEKIMSLSGLDQIEVMRGAQWLNNKCLIVIKEDKSVIAKLTKRGAETAKKGLPELRFLEELDKKNNQSFDDLRKTAGLDANEFNKAMGFCRQSGFVSINQGKIIINNLGKEYLKKEGRKTIILKQLVAESLDVKSVKHEEELDSLKERGLVDVEEKIGRELAATPLGIKVIKRGVDLGRKLLERNTLQVIKSKDWESTDFRRYNVKEAVPKKYYGKLHPYQEFIEKTKDKFASMGFKEMTGPYVENNFTNCDALFMPQDHPARGIHDIFYIKEPEKTELKEYKNFLKKVKKAHEKGIKGSAGWRIPFDEEFTKKHVLRSQTTSASVRMLMNEDLEIPGKYFVIDRNVRPDVIDWKHGAEFLQMEGIVLGEDMNLRSLFGLLRMFAEKVAKVEKYKIMPDYYPYTEPSASLHIFWRGKWMELGGAGIFRKEVTEPLGVKVPVIAWGLGFDRAFMAEKSINDIRQLFTNDLSWLRNAEVKH